MYKLEKTFTSESRPGLKVIFSSENVGIKISGTEDDKSVLDLTLDYNSKSGKEFEVSDFLKLEYNNDLNEMRIKFTEPEGMRVLKAKLELEVPKLSEIQASTENGPIALTGLQGDQLLKTENGPVTLEEISGNIEISGENGPVSATEIEGELIIKIENGPVNIREITGKCSIEGENGIIKLKEGSGELKIRNGNGQIRVLRGNFNNTEIINRNGGIYYEFMPMEVGSFRFMNENGKISLIVPDEIQCDLTAKNELGKINIGIDGNYDKQSEDGKASIHLLKGTGRVKIEASNNNGSINVSKDGIKRSGHINFSGFAGVFDDIMTEIPEIDKEKMKIKLEKVKEKLDNIDLDKIEAKVTAAVKKIEKVVEKEFDPQKNSEIINKVKVNLSRAMEGLNAGSREPRPDSKPDRTNEESRLMILRMLQDGKISSEEAEKLLKAIGD